MIISSQIQDSLELRFSGLACRMNARGEKIISLGLGEPDFPTPKEIIEAANNAMLSGMTRYSNPMGLPDLREAICNKLLHDNKIAVLLQNVIVTTGAKMALSLALGALIEPRDEVINILPCYPSYIPQILIAEPQAVIRNIDMKRDDFSLDLALLEKILNPKVKAVILNYPHNPTGKMLTEDEWSALTDLLLRHNCWIISDEIYEKLSFTEIAHFSPASVLALAPRTITINGFSKAFSMTGWRIGYMVAPDSIMKKICLLQQHMNTNVAPFIQAAAKTALSLPKEYLNFFKTKLASNAKLLEECVSFAPSCFRLYPCSGGLFAFMDISQTGLTSDEFSSGLLERYSVAVTPGINFGPAWDDHVRVSLCADTDVFATGMQRIKDFAGSMK